MSLAVKYRPKSFDTVIGQQAVLKALQAALKRPVVPHTWLLVGPAGTGKTTLARLLAAHFAGDNIEPANLIEVNAAKDSGADSIRDLTVKAQYKAIATSPVKTIIIDEVHALSKAAWSSLLKPIEEPPEHVYWCLCTTELGKIPATIKSRCVTLNLKSVDELQLFELLDKVVKAEGIEILDEILEVVIDKSNGSPRQALTNLELCASAKNVSEACVLMQTVLESKGPIDIARLLVSGKAKWGQIIDVLNKFDNTDAETVRIIVCNYVAACLLKQRDSNKARHLLMILECFSQPYQQSDKTAPLLLSISLALGMNSGG